MKRARPITLLYAALGAALTLLALLFLLAQPHATVAGPLLTESSADNLSLKSLPVHQSPTDISQTDRLSESQLRISQSADESELILRINPDHNWVQGNYEVGHTVWLTLTNSSGDVKDVAELITADLPFGGGTGFHWNPQSSMLPGDWVHGTVSTGYMASVEIGQITGFVDVDANMITGTVDAAWLMPGPVDVVCYTWDAPGWAPNKHTTVIPNGSDTYTCAWMPEEWDVQPGQDITVSYREPDGHQIYGVFSAWRVFMPVLFRSAP